MYVFGIGLHIVAAIFFAVHAIRTNQPMYWLFLLFLFPGLGSIVYAIAVWLPEMRSHRGVRRAGAKVKQLLDPGRELREATEANQLSPSVGNQLRLFDPRTGELLPTPAQRTERAEQRAEEAELQAEVAQERAEAMEAENARLRQLLADLQGRGRDEG